MFSFDKNYRFVVHLDSYNIRPLVERLGVFRLLADVRGVHTISEENTTVVIRNSIGEDDLKWGLKKQWFEGLPLFDTNIEIMFKNVPSPTGGKSYGQSDRHPIRQLRAEFHRKCLGIIRYLRLIHIKDKAKWEEITLKMVNRLDKIKLEKFVYFRSRRHRRSSPMRTPEPEDHTDLLEVMFDAVVWVVWPVSRQHKIHWQWDAEGLARATFRMARDEARTLYGDEFEAVEGKHWQTVLPMNEA